MYNVGQVLFVVLNKKPQIIPVKVVEQVVRRSLDGENIQYSVTVPTSNGDKTFELDELDGEVYTSINDVEQAMLNNAKDMIKRMAGKASSIAENKFDYRSGPDDILVDSLDTADQLSKGKVAKITLDDGVVANVHIPNDGEQ
tara:strand:- start:1100 stop:1525 length:426 start_codon:yes stop_codon:yes gene_type:complete